MTTPAAQKLLDRTPLKSLLRIPEAPLLDCAAKAYELCQQGHHAQAEVIGQGLVATDHHNWYYRTLLAVSLSKLGRRVEARHVVDEGLRFHPGQRDLVSLRAALA